MDEQRKNASAAEADGVIEGRNAVIEALRAGETIDKIYLQKGDTDKTLGHIASRPGRRAWSWWRRTSASWTP